MKNFLLILAVSALISSCGINNSTSSGAAASDSLSGQSQDSKLTRLQVLMVISDTIKQGEPVELKFTVINEADSTQQFLKWHTPFEPLMSKYLDIKDQDGLEVNYRGAMAKRMMPPPSESYMHVNSKDTLVAVIDLLKGYAITKPATYTIIYNSGEISGLVVKDSVSFVYQ